MTTEHGKTEKEYQAELEELENALKIQEQIAANYSNYDAFARYYAIQEINKLDFLIQNFWESRGYVTD